MGVSKLPLLTRGQVTLSCYAKTQGPRVSEFVEPFIILGIQLASYLQSSVPGLQPVPTSILCLSFEIVSENNSSVCFYHVGHLCVCAVVV